MSRRIFKRKRSVALSMAALLLLVLMATMTIPKMVGAQDDDAPYVSEETADYGIYKNMEDVSVDMESHINSPSILQDTSDEMAAMVETSFSAQNRIPSTYEVRDTGIEDPRERFPDIFEDIKQDPMINHTTVTDWILPQPLTEEGVLHYWGVTKYKDGSNSTITSWRQGSLRPTIFFTDSGMDQWLYFNADGKGSTGVLGGYDLRMRISFQWSDLRLGTPQVFPPGMGNVTFRGGLQVEIEELASLPYPVELNIVKGFSYDENNYIFSITFDLAKTPDRLSFFMGSEKIEVGGVDLFQFMANIQNGFANATLGELSGPYTLTFECSEDIEFIHATMGIMRLYQEKFQDLSWLRLGLDPAQGLGRIPQDGRLWLNSDSITSPIDIIKWDAGVVNGADSQIPTKMYIEYCEVRDNLTYAKVDMQDLPDHIDVSIDYSQQKRGMDMTVIDYQASDVIDSLSFETYVFLPTLNGFDMDVYTCTHADIQNIPKKFHIEATSDFTGEFDTGIYMNPSYSIMGNVINNLIGRMASRFYRIGSILRALPENMMTQPSREGWTYIDCYDGYFADINFWHTSGQYIFNPDRNYIAFYRDHSVDCYCYAGLGIYAISGHLKNIRRLQADFSDRTLLEIDSFGHSSLDAFTIDGNNYVFIEISNLPDHLRLNIKASSIFYETDEKDFGDPQNRIGALTLYSQIENSYMELRVLNLPGNFSLVKTEHQISIQTNEFIDMVEFSITNRADKPIRQIKDGNFVYLYSDNELSLSTGRLFGLQSIVYKTGSNGRLDLRIKEESLMRFRVVDKRESNVDISAVLKPFPAHFSMDLPNVVNDTVIRFPDVVNISGIIDYGDMLLGLGDLGGQILSILSNVTNNLVSSFGGIGTDFKFSYDLNSPSSTMDLVAILKKGRTSDMDVPDWTHGMIMEQRTRGDEADLYGHVYLQGLPSSASIELQMSTNRMFADVVCHNYDPDYPFIILDTKGLQDQDVSVYLSGIRSNLNMDIRVEMLTNMNVGGEIAGDVRLNFTDANNEPIDLDQMYVRFRKYSPITSIREAFMPNVPGYLSAVFSMENDIYAEYNSSTQLEYLFVKLSKSLGGRWSNTILILHDLPTHFIASLEANNDFSLKEPIPLQNVPNFYVNTFGSNTLDLFMSVDGAGFGQRGKYELYLRDVGDHTNGRLLSPTEYEFYSAGVGYMDVSVFGLRMMDVLGVDYLSVRGQEIRSFKIAITMLFGLYPIFDMSEVEGKALRVELHSTLYLQDRTMKANVVILDVAFREAGFMEVPTEFPQATDRLSIDMDKHSRHLIIPLPISTSTSLVRA